MASNPASTSTQLVVVGSSNKSNNESNVPTPPSSFCGSDCLYNSVGVPIHKFFHAAALKTDDICDAIDGENSQALKELKLTPSWADRTPPSSSSTEKKATRNKVAPAPMSSAAEGRQTKFSFYDNPSTSYLDDLEKSSIGHRSEQDEGDPNDQKSVRFVPIIDSLFESSFPSVPTANSFASSLTSLSNSQSKRFELINLSSKKQYGRLSKEDRSEILQGCKAYRLQIATFEELFLKEHGFLPQSSEERMQLSSVYRSYREGKRAIRADGACRIQALVRGRLVRSGYVARMTRLAEAEEAIRKEKERRLAERLDAVKKEKERMLAEREEAVRKEKERILAEAEEAARKESVLAEAEEAARKEKERILAEAEDAARKESVLAEAEDAARKEKIRMRTKKVEAAKKEKKEKKEKKDKEKSELEIANNNIKAMAQNSIRELESLRSTLLSCKPMPISKCDDDDFLIEPLKNSPSMTPVLDKNQGEKVKEEHQNHKLVSPEITKEIQTMYFTDKSGAVEVEEVHRNHAWVSPELTKQTKKSLTKPSYYENEGGKPPPALPHAVTPVVTPVVTPKASPLQQQKSLTPESVTRDLIYEYITPDEKRKLATNALTAKLITKGHKLPEHPDAPEAICTVCEMPKLATADGTIVEKCAVCDELLKDISKKIKEQKRQRKLQEKKERKKAKEQKKKDLQNDLATQYSYLDWSTSIPSKVHVPVKATDRQVEEPQQKDERLKQLLVMKHYTSEGLSVNSDSSSEESDSVVDDADGNDAGNTNEDMAKEVEAEQKDEFDVLLDDPAVEELQRKIHGVPATDAEVTVKEPPKQEEDPNGGKKKSKKNGGSEKKKKQKNQQQQQQGEEEKKESPQDNDNKAYGGFASKTDYDSFQQMYGEFEKDHTDVVDFVRERVRHKTDSIRASRSARRKDGRKRSSSMPSLSSMDEDSLCYSMDKNKGNREGKYRSRRNHRTGRHHRDYYEDQDRNNDDFLSADSISELSQSRFEERARDGYYHATTIVVIITLAAVLHRAGNIPMMTAGEEGVIITPDRVIGTGQTSVTTVAAATEALHHMADMVTVAGG
eukprot:CAMPEP_0183711624 /NCGR_PEP_ID=MMETSP0737-20130205/7093_1 /TAXON_ID=385413 /ORGANISM="Thalassiosira miniscula, Strain CCMP1093" /LENGTH=1068 /DNA_ID=CAMNT_0025940183 /DNA_START=35 /DNA_END=3242 /DNA_ORIENTATION=-